MSRRRKFAALLAPSVTLVAGCESAAYPAFETTIAEAPGVVYRFSSAPASSSSPIFMSIEGRDPTSNDRAVRTQLIRKWVAAHAPEGATMANWGSAMCGTERPGEFPGCDILAVNTPSGRTVEYYFYAGNWPFGQ